MVPLALQVCFDLWPGALSSVNTHTYPWEPKLNKFNLRMHRTQLLWMELAAYGRTTLGVLLPSMSSKLCTFYSPAYKIAFNTCMCPAHAFAINKQTIPSFTINLL
jgi:hypothetical protein